MESNFFTNVVEISDKWPMKNSNELLCSNIARVKNNINFAANNGKRFIIFESFTINCHGEKEKISYDIYNRIIAELVTVGFKVELINDWWYKLFGYYKCKVSW